MALQRDFPDVDVHAEIARIREWQAKKRQPVRNWSGFLRTWLSNAVRVRAAHAAPRSAAGRWPAVRSMLCAGTGHSRPTHPESLAVNPFPSFSTPH